MIGCFCKQCVSKIPSELGNLPKHLGAYWLPLPTILFGFSHPYPLLVTVPPYFFSVSVTHTLYWLPDCLIFWGGRSPIRFIGYRTNIFFSVSVTHTLYWLPYQHIFFGFGHPYPLLVTVPTYFFRFRSPIPFIGYRTNVFFSVSVTHTLYWLPCQRIFFGFGHPYPLLVTVPTYFFRFRSPIPFIGYRTNVFFSVSVTHTLYWLPYQHIFFGFSHPSPLLVTGLSHFWGFGHPYPLLVA